MGDEYTTYDDCKSLNTVAPSLELLEYVRGERIDYQPGKVHVVYFWAKYYKGGLPVTEEISKLSEKYKDVLFIAISGDAERREVEKFLQKEQKDEKTGEDAGLRTQYVAFDDKGWTRKMFGQALGGIAVSIPQAFVVNQKGLLAWRQVFSQSVRVADTSFEEQLKSVIAGTALKSNGNKPKVDAGPGEAAECDDMALF